MATHQTHRVRRGNVISKSASRKARAAQFAAADRTAYSRADRERILSGIDSLESVV